MPRDGQISVDTGLKGGKVRLVFLRKKENRQEMQNQEVPASFVESNVSDDEPPLPEEPEGRPNRAVIDAEPAQRELANNSLWKDWRWQLRNRIRSPGRLAQVITGVGITPGMLQAAGRFPMAITPYYASLIRKPDASDPVFCMAVPQASELWNPPFLREDPLNEEGDMPVRGLVHRYPDRALLIATSACAMYCRHCTRKRVTGCRETRISAARLGRTVEYLKSHPGIRDVVVSGGDPFTMTTSAIETVLSALRSVPSVEIIRIGTRTPVTLPFRITSDLVSMLRKYQPVWVNTHFNHPVEITPESAAACAMLADAGIPVGNQTVLLRGVNDTPAVMEELLRGLIRMRVRPYYLFQCDLVRGIEHFRTPLARGIEIMEHLRGRLSGIAIPTFVVDLPGGSGKVPVLPEYVVSRRADATVFRNSEGIEVSYPEPCPLTGSLEQKCPPVR